MKLPEFYCMRKSGKRDAPPLKTLHTAIRMHLTTSYMDNEWEALKRQILWTRTFTLCQFVCIFHILFSSLVFAFETLFAKLHNQHFS